MVANVVLLVGSKQRSPAYVVARHPADDERVSKRCQIVEHRLVPDGTALGLHEVRHPPGRKRIAYVVDRERGDPLKHVDVADGVTSENVTDQRRAINIGHHRPRVGLLKRHNVDAGEAAIT